MLSLGLVDRAPYAVDLSTWITFFGLKLIPGNCCCCYFYDAPEGSQLLDDENCTQTEIRLIIMAEEGVGVWGGGGTNKKQYDGRCVCVCVWGGEPTKNSMTEGVCVCVGGGGTNKKQYDGRCVCVCVGGGDQQKTV